MNIDSGIGGIQEGSLLQKGYKRGWSHLHFRDPFAQQVSQLLRCSGERDPSGKMVVAIVPFPHFSEYFKGLANNLVHTLNENGRNAVLAYPSELEADNGYMNVGGKKVSLLYRFGATQHASDLFREMGTMLRNARSTATLVLGDPSDILVEDKASLALLSSGHKEYVSDDERKLIDAYVPWSRLLTRSSRTAAFTPCLADCEMVMAEKDRFVLKRTNSHIGAHVLVGRGKTSDEWAEAVNAARNDTNIWMVQEYMPSDMIPFEYRYQGGTINKKSGITLSPFIFGKETPSWLVRIQKHSSDYILGRPSNGRIGMTGVAEIAKTRQNND